MSSRPPGALAWTAVALALGLPATLAWLAGPSLQDALALHPSAGFHQSPWRFWTAAWVHANHLHLLANLAGLGLVTGLGWLLNLPPQATLAWCIAWPLTHLALLLDPRLDTYYGLSGVLHAGLTILATTLALQGRVSAPWPAAYGWALLAGILLKCWLENPTWAAVVPRPDLGMNAAPLAHWAGALTGIVITLTLGLLQRHGCSKPRPLRR